MTERFANRARTTLTGTIASDALSLTVASASLFPGQPNFRILVDAELILVTGVAGTTFTITRGIEGTTPASHATGSEVKQVFTAGGLAQAIAEGGGSITNACTLEQFGAAGDGVTDDQDAFEAARVALVAGTYNMLVIGAKTYLVQGTIDPEDAPFPFGITIRGHGPTSVLKTTTNGSVIAFRSVNAGDRAKSTLVADLVIQGDGKATGKTSQDAFRSGYLGGDGSSRTVFLNCIARDAGGHGFINAYSDKLGTGGLNIGCRAYSCWTGLVGQEGESSDFQAIDCTTGVRQGGNHSLLGGGAEGCAEAIVVTGSAPAPGNDAHGIVANFSLTHNPIAIRCQPTNNGQYFKGIRLFDGDVIIENGNLKFHTFDECMIAGKNYELHGKVRWLACTFGMGYHASVDVTDGENEFLEPLGEVGTVPAWIGQLMNCQISFPSDADVTLTSQQSWARSIEVIPDGETVDVDLYNVRVPSRGAVQEVVNRTAETVNYFWAAGDGIAIPPEKTADIDFEYSVGETMVCRKLSDNVAATVPRPGGFDPAALLLTGWWPGDYAGSPLAAAASAGPSAGRDLSEGSIAPDPGTAINGLIPMNGDGTESIGSGLTSDDFFDQNAQSGCFLVKAPGPGVANLPASPYSENQMMGSVSAADWGISWTSVPSVRFWRFNGAAYNEVSVAMTAGTWHLVQFKYDGVNLKIRIDGGLWQSAPCTAAPLTATGQKIFFGIGASAFFTGDVKEPMWSAQVFSDATFDDLLGYYIVKYDL